LRGVFAVPPLARKDDARRALDFDQNDAIVRHIASGGITRFLYGGNAFLHHLTLAEYEQMLEWLGDFAGDLWAIPSAGPSYGRAMDQALLLKKYKFPCVMMLPCADPRDAAGLERGYREFAAAADARLIVYLKEENSFGADPEPGLDVVARLIESGVCVGIKYAVVRSRPAQDAYLAALLRRVDRGFVVSGIGERPAINHMREWRLPGFTTGSGCIAPRLSQMIYEACVAGDEEAAERLRAAFMPHEDLRDNWHPAKVLHFATELAGIAKTGPVPPFLSSLSAAQQDTLASVARALWAQNRQH
ncbi:MAG: dihydrodipicolinate synthase family protein, partial [Pyrinomonadaceae bacterium]